MEQSEPKPVVEVKKTGGAQLNWRIVRKVEGLVFTSMLLAVPFFAFRIVDTTGTALMVKNTSVDLVRDLIRARSIARDYKLPITVSSLQVRSTDSCAYVIQNGPRTIEQIVLPHGVSMSGSVTFDENGTPKERSSFVVSKGLRSVTVEVDSTGKTAVHESFM
jgi:hypothetical protein